VGRGFGRSSNPCAAIISPRTASSDRVFIDIP
jgi:hypothetical protein